MGEVERKVAYTPRAPVRQGVYSQAIVVDRTVYVSGQLGMDPVSSLLVPGGVQAQARQALVNMGEILKAAGCGYENVVKTTVLLADINDFDNVNEVYKQCKRLTDQLQTSPQCGAVKHNTEHTCPRSQKNTANCQHDSEPFFMHFYRVSAGNFHITFLKGQSFSWQTL
uniref:2-iminobutanoate/2-iminopropanoate deaminase n=1 Tax=Denticeps clupeoides TaxID=299321 RepID=A0AAY4EHD4_9TELE